MEIDLIQAALSGLSLGSVRYFESIGSTNDEAARWAGEQPSPPDFSLVLASEQTAGRGRRGRQWISPKDSSLAFSLILYPTQVETQHLTRFAALGALAVITALQSKTKVPAQIKWPNDIVINYQKIGGILAEVHWQDEKPQVVVLGIGINVATKSAAAANALLKKTSSDTTGLTATSIEAVLERQVDHLDLLQWIVEDLINWRQELVSNKFLSTWENNLVWRGNHVQVQQGNATLKKTIDGILTGITHDGSLRLQTADGDFIEVSDGEVSLRTA